MHCILMVVSTFYDIVRVVERLDDFKYQGLFVSITSLDGQALQVERSHRDEGPWSNNASCHEIPTTGLSHGMCSAPLRRWLDKARALPSPISTRSALSDNVSPPLQALILPRGAARPERG
jgi:hypothetical protein